MSEKIITNLADESGSVSKPRKHGKDIAGSPSGICLEGHVFLRTYAVVGKIYQKLAKSRNIVFFHIYHQTGYAVTKEL